MEKTFTVSYFLKAALAFVLMSALSSSVLAQTTGIISKPGKVAYFEYDNNNWVHKHNTTNTYDSAGKLVLVVNTAPVTNHNLEKLEYTKSSVTNATGLTITTSGTFYTWQNNAWVMVSKSVDITVRNAANQTTEYIWQDYQNGAMSNSRKKAFTYDAAGDMVEEAEYLWFNNAWQNFYRYAYTYVQGSRTEKLTYKYNNTSGSWDLLGKAFYTGWHIPNQQPVLAVGQSKDASGNWINTSRSTTTLGANGSFKTLTEKFTNNSWVNYGNFSVLYDVHKNITEEYFEQFMNGAWQVFSHDRYFYTYTPQNDLQERVNQRIDIQSGTLINDRKYVYSDFQYFGNAINADQGLTVFPNPATNKIQIAFTESKPQALTATLQDVTGKIRQTQSFTASETKQLDIENLPKGIYLLQLQTESGSEVKRIVKQ